MELTLKDRKAIQNKVLPKFAFGWEQPSLADMITDAGSFQHSSKTEGVTSAADAFKADTVAENKATTDLGGMPSSWAKKPNATGQFLKNNAGGIMNIASTGIDFFSTLGDISKNKMTSDQMMGSGGLTSESANGISYQQSKVDQAGILNQIDATAKAGTMASMGKGAALGGAIGSVIPGLGTVAGGVIGGVVGGIAGLFGSRSAKREAERQKKIAMDRTAASNTLNREMAYTIGLRNEFNRENRTDTSQSLFHAALGVEDVVNPITRETYKKHIVNTKYGKIKTNQNAWVSDEEVIGNKNDGHLYKVRGGKNDTARAYLEPGDSVYSKKVINPETGNPVADDAPVYAAMGMLDRLDMNLNVGRMMAYAGKRKPDTNTGYLGGTLKKYGVGDENIVPPPLGWSTYFAGRPANVENGIIGGTMKGGGFDALEGMPGLVISGRRTIDTMPRAKRPSNSQIDIMPGSRSSQSATGLVSQMSFGDAPLGIRARGKNNIPDAMPVSSAVDRGSEVVSQMQIPGSEEHIKDGARTPGNTNGGAKKPGLFGKIKGVLGGLGGDIDLGNIALLGNAYLTAAQRDARAEGLRAPKSFVANPYEQDALQQLNTLHSDYYPVWAMNRELEGRGKSSIAQSGGLAAGQKMLGYMGLTNQTQQNNMAALFEHQGRENALRALAAKASLEAGNQSATRQQQAYQWDEDMRARAHAAQDNMFETSAYDRQNGLTQFFKNLWEKNQFDRTMNLYESQLKDDRAKTQAIINSLSTKQNPEVEKATIAPQTIATMQKLWNRNPLTVDLGELELPEFAVTPAKKVAKPKVTKRRTVKRGGKK